MMDFSKRIAEMTAEMWENIDRLSRHLDDFPDALRICFDAVEFATGICSDVVTEDDSRHGQGYSVFPTLDWRDGIEINIYINTGDQSVITAILEYLEREHSYTQYRNPLKHETLRTAHYHLRHNEDDLSVPIELIWQPKDADTGKNCKWVQIGVEMKPKYELQCTKGGE